MNSLPGSHTQPADSAYGSLTRKVAQAMVIAAMKGATEVPEGPAALWRGGGVHHSNLFLPSPFPFFLPTSRPPLPVCVLLASWVSNPSRLSSSSLSHIWHPSRLHPPVSMPRTLLVPIPRRQRVSTFPVLQPFNTILHAVATPDHTNYSRCYFTTIILLVMIRNVNI